jgi:DNA-binding transcriptional LysR family regulator
MRDSDISGSHARTLIARVDLALLELFDCVYRLRSLTLAGAQLGLTQPAVSRGLARLRTAYGDVLFVRRQRGVLPTPFADHLAKPLADALAIVRGTVERPRFDASTDRRCFRIAMSDIGERFFLPRLVGHLAKVAPHVAVEAVSQALPQLKAGLESGDIDLVAGYLPDLGKQVRQQRLFREHFVYVARARHPLIQGALRREQLRELPHVLASPPGTPHAAAVEKVLTSTRVRATIALRVRSFLCLAPIVAETDLVAAMPSNLVALVATSLGLQRIESPVPIPGFDVSIGWHDRYHRDPAIEWLRGQFVELFRKPDVAAGER